MRAKVGLKDTQLPRQWYNLAADLPGGLLPPRTPDGNILKPEQLSALFPEPLIEQEISQQRWIDIPEEVLEILARWRPTPLVRARKLERALNTPARIYYKNESVSPAGSHKPNTAVPQAYYNKLVGTKRLTTETGAGQWGSALSFASAQFGLECQVFMVRSSYEKKPYRKVMMQTWGASCTPSPSPLTRAGRAILSEHPDSPGSLGIAISEAVEAALADASGQTHYALGSVLNHVMLHQTIIGLEAKRQLMQFGEKTPDTIIACVGGGSNFAGLSFPFIKEKIEGANIDIVPVEPASCPSITRGLFAYDFGDTAGMTPLLAMYTLGHTFMPSPSHAGGLRYHGMAPLVSEATRRGLLRPEAISQVECFSAAVQFARTEGIIVAPETSHAVAQVIREAIRAKEEKREKVILFGLSGHGLLDLQGYAEYFAGEIKNLSLQEDELKQSLASLPNAGPAL
jgi:tryptophan synthase beta chain